ncbi:MAG: hypothetical protein JWN33_91 [Candidatus Saccharibacteria bacterium]|nr:hypothetical protein [Candidatus Saccharibacteria bacterium]
MNYKETLIDGVSYESEDGDVLPHAGDFGTIKIAGGPDPTEYMVERAVSSDKLAISYAHLPSYDGMTEFFPATPEEQAQPVPAERPGEMTREQKLYLLKQREGFYPQTNDEFVRMMVMTGNTEGRFPALSHLDEVYAHQRNHKVEEPFKALRHIMNEFHSYARDAQLTSHFVEELHDRIEACGVSNFTAFSNIPDLRDWKYEDTTRRALTVLAKHIEIDAYAREEGTDPLSKKTLIDTARDKDSRIAHRIGSLRVNDITRISADVILEQEKRLDYWITRIEEAKRHMAVRGQGYQALRNLGIEKYKK